MDLAIIAKAATPNNNLARSSCEDWACAVLVVLVRARAAQRAEAVNILNMSVILFIEERGNPVEVDETDMAQRRFVRQCRQSVIGYHHPQTPAVIE
jgi:hypothetical protein